MKHLLTRLEALLLAACAGLFFLPLGTRALWDSDEGRYAEIAREMLVSHDWLIPHLNGVLYFEKPPFAYWCTALGMRLFGVNEFGARFFSAFFGLLTIAGICRIGRAWRNERMGLLAGSILATSTAFFVLTQYLVVDMVLAFWFTLTLEAGLHLVDNESPAQVRGATYVLAVAIAGGFLTKGLIALLLPGMIIGLTFGIHPFRDRLRQMPLLGAGTLFLVLTVPWVGVVSHRYPFFASFFFIHEHFARFFTHVHQRSGPIYYFIPVILVGFLPWIVFLPGIFRHWFGAKAAALRRDAAGTLILLWAVVIFLFFSMSGSKLPAYMLPVFPALALLLADFFDAQMESDVMPRWLLWGLDALILFFMTLLALLKWTPAPGFMQQPPVDLLVEQGGMLGLILAVCTLILVGVWGIRQMPAAFGGVLVVQALFLSSLTTLAPMIDPWLSTQRLAQVIATRARPEDAVVVYGVSYETYTQSLAFYTARRITIYGPVGEFALGAAHAADAAEWFVDGDAATAALKTTPIGTWVITNEEYENKLQAAGIRDNFATVEKSGRLALLQRIQ